MAVISKIRNKLGMVMVGAIALAIVSFLLMDALNSDSSLLSFTPKHLAVIEGNTIEVKDFDKRYQDNLDNYKNQLQQTSLDEMTSLSLRDQTWSQLLNEYIMGKEYQKLGILVTSEELYDLIQGPNPHPSVVQAFTDPNTNRFDPNQVVLFIQNMDNDETGDTRDRWLNFEKFIKEERLRAKYNNLIKKGIYVPTWLAKTDYELKNKSVDFDFVYLAYAEISDNDVSITDDDIKNYINKNKGKFKQTTETRNVEFISFDVFPSAEDTAKALNWLENQLENFETTEDDSIFIVLTSDLPFTDKYFTLEELESSVADTFFRIDPETIVGPYLEENYFIAAKLLDRKIIPDSVEARHILLVPKSFEEREQMLIQADSLKKVIEDGGEFAALASAFSKDPATAMTGGNWGVVKPGEKFENIDKGLFHQNKQGDVFVALSNEGIHIVQITQAKPSKTGVKVAFLAREINASQETQRLVFSEASKFAGANNSIQKFRESELKDQIKKAPRLERNDYNIFGVGVSREIVKWAFEDKNSNIPKVFTLDDKYVVAVVSSVQAEGLASVAAVRDEIKPQVIKEKKAEMLMKKVKDVGAGSLNQLAGTLGVEIQSARGINFSNNFLPGAGMEPVVANKAFSLSAGNISEPVKGENGVFVLNVTNTTPAPQVSDYNLYKQQVKSPIESRVEGALFEALKKSADIDDNRHVFY